MVMFLFKVIGLGFMNDSACIYMCCNIERNIMKKKSGGPEKNQYGSPGFGIHGKSLCICFVFLTVVYFLLFLRISLQVIFVHG